MKVLLVTETLNVGGAEIFVLRLARALQFAGVDVEVLSLNKKYENKEMTAAFTDIPIRRMHLPLLSLCEFADRGLSKLKIDYSIKYTLQRKKLQKIAADFDIIHTHYIQVDHLVAKMKRAAHTRHIVSVHGDYSAQYASFKRGELRFWLHLDKKLEFLSSKVDQWVVLSSEQEIFFEKVMKMPPQKIRLIYNGYQRETGQMNANEKSAAFTVGMVSRGTEKKGWQILIDAFLKLPKDSRLILVGSSFYLDKLAKKYAEEKRILFAGFQAEPARWFKQLDVSVLPSLYPYESLPNVIIESLFCGIPVVASNIGEISTMITDEDTGKKAGYVIPFDGEKLDEAVLLDRLVYLYNHPEQRIDLGIIAIKAAQKFTMDRCVKDYIDLYRSILV